MCLCVCTLLCKKAFIMTTTFTEQHEALSAIAVKQNCGASSLVSGSVSTHTLPETASFSNVDAISSATKSPVYIGTSASELVLSAHLSPDEEDAEQRPKKRRRSSNYETEVDDTRKIAEARMRLEKSVPELQSDELDVAQKVLTKLAKELRGPAGEVVVQSTAILAKKLGASDPRQRVVVAARLNAGIAIRVDVLRSCMGVCWADGLLTTLPTLHGIGKIELPLSEEAHAALAFGNSTLLLVTSVAMK